ncbi:hypothetical protein Nepgr_003366 [Nepenthes gracilis]|uniref:F-box domain-containing protein n=1 Tax=Nepenthes gracilis TaxID=150966 RepID=A0AAD3XDH7_NEPGR|nr:hypothetical protein Nepgr_003366 [Nepenthes gracilis]
MALNFSHCPIFPPHLSDDNLAAPIRITNGCLMEGIPERGGDGFGRMWRTSEDVHNCFDYGGDSIDRSDPQGSASKDILDLLPADPFGMDISSTFTAITGWLEDLETDYGWLENLETDFGGWLEDLETDYGRYTMANVGTSKGDFSLFSELDLIWNKAMGFQVSANSKVDDELLVAGRIGRCSEEGQRRDSFYHGGFGPFRSMGDFHLGASTTRIDQNQNPQLVAEICVDVESGGPHPALAFALGYLGVRDLLCLERVCKSLHYTVQNDPLLWKSIHIDQPLNDRITNDVLLHLTNRAQGNLQCLSLVECQRITSDGLKQVLESNLRLTKLSVAGSTRLGVDGIVDCLKAFNSVATIGIKQLRMGGIYGVTHDHFEELKSLLGISNHKPASNLKPHFYGRGNLYISLEDDRAIDIEICPRCQNLRLVYDCPAESCKGKDHATQVCRACLLCIARCIQCGRCINDGEYEETFCLEFLCSSCWKRP